MLEQQFRKYRSMENAYREYFIQSIREQALDQGEFWVEEKVHGANLSFWSDGQRVLTAKRTEVLNTDDDFYGFQALQAAHETRILALFQDLKQKRLKQNQDIQVMAIFGEFCGGDYPHPEVPAQPQCQRIQKGIFYHPGHLFFAFDLYVDGEYLPLDQAHALFEKHGFLYAKALFKGSFQDALDYPVDGPSQVALQMGLPVIEKNNMEGVVIKPCTPRYFANGARVIIKNKSDRWKENIPKVRRPHKLQPADTPAFRVAWEQLWAHANPNRLQNVLSKTGPEAPVGKILGLLGKDAFADFSRDYPHLLEPLEKAERKLLTKRLNSTLAPLIKNWLAELRA